MNKTTIISDYFEKDFIELNKNRLSKNHRKQDCMHIEQCYLCTINCVYSAKIGREQE